MLKYLKLSSKIDNFKKILYNNIVNEKGGFYYGKRYEIRNEK